MAGSHHSGRRPNRISSIGRRDGRAAADARRVAEADLRLGLYVRPDGLGIHVVKNPCNDQEYKVTDATSGATFSAGAAVVLGSFTGNPGEMILGRPPSGFGGASGYSASPVSVGYGPPVASVPVMELDQNTFACDPTTGKAVFIARSDGLFAVLTVPIGSLPLLATEVLAEATVVGFAPATFDSTGHYTPLLIAVASGPKYLVLFGTGNTGVNDSQEFSLLSMDSSGAILATDTWIGPNGSFWDGSVPIRSFDWCLSGGALYLLEPREEDPTYSGPPYPTGLRVTRRNPSTLDVDAEYPVPSVTPYDGVTSSGQIDHALAPRSGGVSLFFRSNAGAIDHTYWRRDLDNSLAVVGADVRISNVGKDETYQLGPGGHRFRQIGATLYAIGVLNPLPASARQLFSVGASTVTLIGAGLTSAAPAAVESSGSQILLFYRVDGSTASPIVVAVDVDGTEHIPS